MAQRSGDNSQGKSDIRHENDDSRMPKRLNLDRRIMVASNRGPFSYFEDDTGQLAVKRDFNLADEALDGLNLTWISGAVSSADRKAVQTLSSEQGLLESDQIPDAHEVHLVAPPRRVHHKFYNVICNPLLWFLFHRSWSPTFTPTIGAQEHDAWDNGFRAVNTMFADAISQNASEKPFVLVSQDYQLISVPGMVRESHPDSIIQHSLDTPWPWPSDLEILPAAWRVQILESMLSANELWLPSKRDINAFIACLNEFLQDAIEVTDSSTVPYKVVSFKGRKLLVGVSRPAVRLQQFKSLIATSRPQRFVNDLADESIRHTFVTVDRSEPHRNIVRSINAFGELLKQNPELASDVRYLLFLTPGPSHISAYKRLSNEVRRAARRVNEKTGVNQPVRVSEESNFYRAVAALSVYDTLVSVPVVDGIGRAALDGAVLNSSDGGMILSNSSVTADWFGDSATLVDFADVGAITEAMAAAASESAESRQRRSKALTATVGAMTAGQLEFQIIAGKTLIARMTNHDA